MIKGTNKCKYNFISGSAEIAIAAGVSPDDIDVLNDKRVANLLSSYSESLHNTFVKRMFASLDYVTNKHIELFREMTDLALQDDYPSKEGLRI